VTIIYTFIGGIKAVIWMDVVQMLVYIGGAVGAMFVLLGRVPDGWWMDAVTAGKTRLVDFGVGGSFSDWLTQPYTFFTAVVGGAIFSMASHGTDQLIVQRLLTCRNLRDSQKALVTSGFVVMLQFALFLVVGLLLWSFYGAASPVALGLTRGDEVFPKFIIEGLPPGVSGLLLAGIVAAAMSTLSSSLNSLASSSMLDLYERIRGRVIEGDRALFMSRMLTLVWGVIFIFFANLFEDQENPVVELGLAIASFTYGGLLGVFLLGLVNKATDQKDALIAFVVTIAFMVWVIFAVWYSPTDGWIIYLDPSDEAITAGGLRTIGWPWYTVIGSMVTLVVGSLLALRHR
ncbi:MAG: sodium:solute symporter, partial [Rhodothermales bacterium]